MPATGGSRASSTPPAANAIGQCQADPADAAGALPWPLSTMAGASASACRAGHQAPAMAEATPSTAQAASAGSGQLRAGAMPVNTRPPRSPPNHCSASAARPAPAINPITLPASPSSADSARIQARRSRAASPSTPSSASPGRRCASDRVLTE